MPWSYTACSTPSDHRLTAWLSASRTHTSAERMVRITVCVLAQLLDERAPCLAALVLPRFSGGFAAQAQRGHGHQPDAGHWQEQVCFRPIATNTRRVLAWYDEHLGPAVGPGLPVLKAVQVGGHSDGDGAAGAVGRGQGRQARLEL